MCVWSHGDSKFVPACGLAQPVAGADRLSPLLLPGLRISVCRQGKMFEPHQCNRNRLWKQGSLLLLCFPGCTCLCTICCGSASQVATRAQNRQRRPKTDQASTKTCRVAWPPADRSSTAKTLYQIILHPDFLLVSANNMDGITPCKRGRMQPGCARGRPGRRFHLVPFPTHSRSQQLGFGALPLCHRLNLRLEIQVPRCKVHLIR